MFIIPIKDLDLKAFIDYSSVFSKAKDGSQVKISQQYTDILFDTLLKQQRLPIKLNVFVQLIEVILQDKSITVNFLFLKKVIISYLKTKNNVSIDLVGGTSIVSFVQNNNQ